MKLIQTRSLKPNQIMGRPVYDINGRVLINKSVQLTERLISRLKEYGITYVYILDDQIGEIDVNHPISDEAKRESIKSLQGVFSTLKQKDHAHNTYVVEKSRASFDKIIDTIIGELDQDNHLISLLTDVLDFDNHTFEHSVNVTMYAISIGKQLGLQKGDLQQLGLGALLHDVGKMFIPVEVLNKPARLTDEEYEIIKKHPVFGYNLLRNIQSLPLVISHCALQHHERLDGKGYPLGVESAFISYYAKIIAVADVFDAVTSNRVYRKAMLPHEAMEILYAGVDKQFDFKIVEAFKEVVIMYPNGITVELSDGCKGVVIKQNKGQGDRPIIKVYEKNGDPVKPFIIDLSKVLNVIISSCLAS